MAKYTLGLCTMDNSAAALFSDGELIAAVEEERLSRIKNDGAFPYKSIDEVLSIQGIEFDELDVIAIYWQQVYSWCIMILYPYPMNKF